MRCDKSLRLEELLLPVELGEAVVELVADPVDGPEQILARRHIVGPGVDRQPVEALQNLSPNRIDALDGLHLVAPERDPHRGVVIGRVDLEDIAAQPEAARREIEVGALVLHLGELAEDLLHGLLGAGFEELEHVEVGLGRTETVDAAHRGDDEDIAALEK